LDTFVLEINGKEQQLETEPELPLLWLLRDTLGLTGTKFGCGRGLCGACTVHVNGQATRSCITSISEVQRKKVTTIEGLAADPAHPVLRAWIAEQVPQCGFCQSGQIMQAAALLARNPRPTPADVDAAMAEILCRCGTYLRIRRALRRAAQGGEAR
jgi:aerobic-type carbon monoxide dehydrogenase small subunit (CoxS/CutS family)